MKERCSRLDQGTLTGFLPSRVSALTLDAAGLQPPCGGLRRALTGWFSPAREHRDEGLPVAGNDIAPLTLQPHADGGREQPSFGGGASCLASPGVGASRAQCKGSTPH